MKRAQQGFAIVEAVLIVVVLAGLAGVGYVVLKKHNTATNNTVSSSTEKSSAATVPEAPAINNSADLTKAQQTVDETDLNTTNADSSQLDSMLNEL
jgi:uncharacterized protein HemX